MSWTDFFTGTDPEKYDPNSPDAQKARTVGPANHGFDAGATQAEGTQLNTGNYDQTRAQQQGLSQQLNQAGQGLGPSGAGLAANAQRSSALTQAAALQSGRRGRSAVAGGLMAQGAATMGNQQASQNEAIGRANEMATARGQNAGLLSGMAGQDVNVAGQNAQLGQQSNQYNATNRQNVNLANQGAQLGIAGQEMNARMHQGDMAYGNLKPGSEGLFSPGNIVKLGVAAGQVAGAVSDRRAKTDIEPIKKMANGGVVVPKMSLAGLTDEGRDRRGGDGRGGVQLMGIGQRVVPNWHQHDASAYGNALGSAVAGIVSQKAADKLDEREKAIKSFHEAELRGHSGADYAHGQGSVPHDGVTEPAAGPPLYTTKGTWSSEAPELPSEEDYPDFRGHVPGYARGGYIDHPTLAVIGEAGPEMVVPLGRGHEGMQQKARGILAHLDQRPSRPGNPQNVQFVQPPLDRTPYQKTMPSGRQVEVHLSRDNAGSGLVDPSDRSQQDFDYSDALDEGDEQLNDRQERNRSRQGTGTIPKMGKGALVIPHTNEWRVDPRSVKGNAPPDAISSADARWTDPNVEMNPDDVDMPEEDASAPIRTHARLKDQQRGVDTRARDEQDKLNDRRRMLHEGPSSQNGPARRMLDDIKPYSYFYKPDVVRAGSAPPGPQVGVLAQDMEKSPAGRDLVGQDPATGYKTIDYAKSGPVTFAAMSDLNQRLSRLEGRGRR